jgi:hypothetical protein
MAERPHRRVVEALEANIDGRLGDAEFQALVQAASQKLTLSGWEGSAINRAVSRRPQEAIEADRYASWAFTHGLPRRDEVRAQADVVRDLFGNPFRPVVVARSWLTWNGGTVAGLACQIYDERAFDRLPVLADALEDAGCDNADLLAHLRRGGDHYLGCWALDLLRKVAR